MTPDQLKKISKKLYGHFWRSQLALNLGISTSTVDRWADRDRPISHLAEVAVRGLVEKHKANQAEEKRRNEQLRKQGRLRPKLRRRTVKEKTNAQ